MIYPLTHILAPDLPQETLMARAPDVSRAMFRQAVYALASRLQSAHIRQAALWFDDAAAFSCAILAAWQAGIDVCLLPNLAAENVAWVAHECDVLLTDDAAAHESFSGSLNVWCNDFLHDDGQPDSFRQPEFVPIDAARCAYLKTSGSSGVAQIVAKTAAQMQEEALVLANVLPCSSTTAHALSSVSLQHMYGFTFRFAVSLTLGWQLSRTQNLYPETLLADTAHTQNAIWISSPALLNRVVEHGLLPDMQGKVCGILSAGGALPDRTAARLAEHLVLPHEIYGSTETGVIAHRQGSGLWQPLPAVQCGSDEAGALWVQSPWSARHQSADAVHWQADGFTLLGRLDRIIKFEDKRVSLNQIEHDLLAHPWLDDVHCAPHPQHRRPAAWAALSETGIAVLREQGRAAVIRELKHHLARTLDKVVLPRYWCFAAQLPRNAQAKIAAADFQAAFTVPQRVPLWQAAAENNAVSARFYARVPLDLQYFSGHFAAFALVPGVVELDWVCQLCRQWTWGQNALIKIENLKFQQFVRPHDEICVSLDYDAVKHKAGFKITNADKTCASGRLVYAA